MPNRAAAANTRAGFVVNRDWTVLSCTPAAMPWLAASLGLHLWKAWPNAEPIFRPIYERAWRDGSARGREFFAGALVEVEATVVGDRLVIHFEERDHLDVTSPQSVVESLTRILALARGQEPDPALARAEVPLRVVPGSRDSKRRRPRAQ